MEKILKNEISEGLEQYNYFKKNMPASPKEYEENIQRLIKALDGVEKVEILCLDDEKIINTFKQVFKGIETTNERYHYVWLSLASDGFVVVVGKSTYNKKSGYIGDALKDYTVAKTAQLIATIVDKNNYLKDALKKVNNFVKKIIIVPISSSESYTILEKEIGETLLNNGIPILNTKSHL